MCGYVSVHFYVQVYMLSQNTYIPFNFCNVEGFNSSSILAKNRSVGAVVMFLSVSYLPHKHEGLMSDQ